MGKLMIFASMVFGLFGCFAWIVNPEAGALGMMALIVGGLLFLWGNRSNRNAREERRHAEMVEAIKNGSLK